MIYKVRDFEYEFPDDRSCLEWLKNQLHPKGIECKVCKKITKHHKVSNRHCYSCDNCGNQVYPTAGTIFHKSRTPLKTWFQVIYKLSNAKKDISAKEVQREYHVTYKTARRMLRKIKEFLSESSCIFTEAKASRTYHRDNQFIADDRGGQPDDPVTAIINRKADKNTDEYHQKRDRTARLLRLQMLLAQSPAGLEIKEIAHKCAVSKRTVYRDLIALESEIGIPLWEQGTKRGIVEGYFLPPITLTPEEAINVFLATRLIQNYSYLYSPSAVSTFMKLEMIVREPLKTYIKDAIEYLDDLPKDERKTNNFNKIARAWLSKHRVRIQYQEPFEEKLMECVIEPYYIEPSVLGHSSYVIAYCHSTESMHTYKLDYVVGDASIEAETYEIPSNFKIGDYLGSAWDNRIMQPELIKLRFTQKISNSIIGTIWHPSQDIELFSNGSGVMTLRASNCMHFRAWILGWGEEMEVLEPESLRIQILQLARSLISMYDGVKSHYY